MTAKSINKADLIQQFMKAKDQIKPSYMFSSQTIRFDGSQNKTLDKSKEQKLIEELDKNFTRPSFLKTNDPKPVLSLKSIKKDLAFGSHSPRFRYSKGQKLNKQQGIVF